MLRGLWHAHMGWLFDPDAPGLSRYVGDLRRDPLIRTISSLFPLWVVLGLLIPAAITGLLTMSWMGALLGFLWGGLARICLVHHITWSVNSKDGTTTITHSPTVPVTACTGGKWT